MILNVWSAVNLFLAAVTAALALAVAAVALRGLRASRAAAEGRDPDAADSRANLLALLAGTLLLVRLLAWPEFYFLLKSFVSDFASLGVMCTYGVTRVQGGLVRALEILKPATLFLLGLWWLVELANRRTAERRLAGPGFALALGGAGMALAECAVEALYLFAEKGGKPVTCCTQFLDTGASSLRPDAAWFDARVFGEPVAALLAAGLLHAGAVAGGWSLAARARRSGRPRAGAWPALLAGAALLNLALTRIAWHDTVAPRVLRLPYHHCVYELLTDLPVMGFAALLTVAGTAGLVWPAALALWRSRAPAEIAALQADAWRLGALALASAALIVGIMLV